MKGINLAILTGLLILSSSVFAKKDAKKFDGIITQKQLSEMSYTRLQILRASYVEFLAKSEGVMKIDPLFKGQKQSSFQQFKKYYTYIQRFYSAYGADGDICFFGGWPSKMSGNFCKVPWKYNEDSDVKSYGQTYKSFCPSSSQFRCHPLLFGTEEGSDQGVCIETQGTYRELTQRCEQQSQKNVPELLAKMQNDPKMQADLVKFNEAIFGKDNDGDGLTEGGFCNNFSAEYNKEYDACDDLKKRLDSLIDPNKNGQPNDLNQAGGKSVGPQVDGEAKNILARCDQVLKENGIKDANNRQLIETLNGGTPVCIDKTVQGSLLLEDMELEDFDHITDQFMTAGYLHELNIKNFKQKLQGLLNTQVGYMSDMEDEKLPVEDKIAFRALIEKRFPELANNPYYQKAFEDVYNKFQQDKAAGLIPKIKYEDAFANLKKHTNETTKEKITAPNGVEGTITFPGVNETCSKIHAGFKKQHDDKKLHKTLEWARWYSDEEDHSIAAYKKDLDASLNRAFGNSGLGFLVGTKQFKKYVMDPTVNLTKECVQNPGFQPVNPHMQKDTYQKALVEARDHILDSFGDLQKKEEVVRENKTKKINESVQEYLLTNKPLVYDVLASSSNFEQKMQAEYLCKQIEEAYEGDMSNKSWSIFWGITGVTAAAACAFLPTSAIGCTAVGIMTSTGLLATAAPRAWEGYKSKQNASLNQMVKERVIANYNDQMKAANDQLFEGSIALGSTAAGPVFSAGKKGYAFVKGLRTKKGSGMEAGPALRAPLPEGVKFGEYVYKALPKGKTLPRGNDVIITPPPASPVAKLPGAAKKLPPGLPTPRQANTITIRVKNPKTGEMSSTRVSQEVLENSRLTNFQRKKAIAKEFKAKLSPDLETRRAQVGIIHGAHKKKNYEGVNLRCAIGECSQLQLRMKMKYMTDNGIPKDVASASIRKGYTGYSPDWIRKAEANEAFFGSKTLAAYGKQVPTPYAQVIKVPQSNPNHKWVELLQDTSKNFPNGQIFLKVEKSLAKGKKELKEFRGSLQGTDGKHLIFDGPDGRFIIDPSDINIAVKSIKVRSGGGAMKPGQSNSDYFNYMIYNALP